VLFVVSCAEAGDPSLRPDSSSSDASCTPQTFFRDTDGDQHGDPARAVMACDKPADAVTNSTDCDDANAERHPGLAETCDGYDNDCSPATAETCPAGCQVMRRPAPDDAKVYLFCSSGPSWPNARATCASAQMKLAEIESGAENAFVRTTANGLYGASDLHIGGSDSIAEGQWMWDGSVQFWQGGSGGAAVMNRFANWVSGEPNDDGTEDCAEMKPDGRWNDGDCGDGQRFVCRR
jgi:hypothetical protein